MMHVVEALCGATLTGALLCGCGHDAASPAPDDGAHRLLAIDEPGDMADPHVILVDRTFYLYATHSQVDLEVWTSEDLVHWEDGGVVWAPTAGSWNAESSDGGIWAPAVVATPDGYYLYYTANMRIGVARADSPYGPFVDLYDHPFVGNGYAYVGDGVLGEPGGDLDERAIDAFVLQASDGSLTLYFVGNDPLSTIYGVPMLDYATLKDVPPTRLLGPEQPWESVVCEGPFVTEHDGRFHLSYSGNIALTVSYAIGAAVGDASLGPFERYADNPILAQIPELEFYGPGHHSIVEGDDGLLVFYHTKMSSSPGYDRRLRVAPIRYADGLLHIDPPTHR
jgi:beta-xylosidase